MDIGEQLRAMRERAGLSKRELSRRLGLTHQSIMYIERGDNLPGVDTLEAWATACGCAIRFVRSTGLTTDDEEILERLAAVLPYVPEARRDVLIAQLRIWEEAAARAPSSSSSSA